MNLLDRIEDMLTTMGRAISRSNARPSGMNENTRTSESKSLGHTSKLSPGKKLLSLDSQSDCREIQSTWLEVSIASESITAWENRPPSRKRIKLMLLCPVMAENHQV